MREKIRDIAGLEARLSDLIDDIVELNKQSAVEAGNLIKHSNTERNNQGKKLRFYNNLLFRLVPPTERGFKYSIQLRQNKGIYTNKQGTKRIIKDILKLGHQVKVEGVKNKKPSKFFTNRKAIEKSKSQFLRGIIDTENKVEEYRLMFEALSNTRKMLLSAMWHIEKQTALFDAEQLVFNCQVDSSEDYEDLEPNKNTGYGGDNLNFEPMKENEEEWDVEF